MVSIAIWVDLLKNLNKMICVEMAYKVNKAREAAYLCLCIFRKLIFGKRNVKAVNAVSI